MLLSTDEIQEQKSKAPASAKSIKLDREKNVVSSHECQLVLK